MTCGMNRREGAGSAATCTTPGSCRCTRRSVAKGPVRQSSYPSPRPAHGPFVQVAAPPLWSLIHVVAAAFAAPFLRACSEVRRIHARIEVSALINGISDCNSIEGREDAKVNRLDNGSRKRLVLLESHDLTVDDEVPPLVSLEEFPQVDFA